MTSTYVIYIVILALCTVASGFFSGSETALIGISKERVHLLAAETKHGHRVEQLVAYPERMLSTLLVANNVVNVLAAAVATTLFISLIGERWGPWLATLVVTAVILVFGEITPKTLATRYPERFAFAVAPAIWQLSRILAPMATFFRAITRGLLRLFRIPVEGDSTAVTDADIRALARFLGRLDFFRGLGFAGLVNRGNAGVVVFAVSQGNDLHAFRQLDVGQVQALLELEIAGDIDAFTISDSKDLEDWFVVSGVAQAAIGEELGRFSVEDKHFTLHRAAHAKCPRCWRYTALDEEHVCARCAEVLG